MHIKGVLMDSDMGNVDLYCMLLKDKALYKTLTFYVHSCAEFFVCAGNETCA